MRVPRIHHVVLEDDPDALFRKLPAGRRFRFAGGPGAPTVLGAWAVAELRASRHDADPFPLMQLRGLLPRVPAARRDGLFPGGAVGALTYEACAPPEGLPPRAPGRDDPPDVVFHVVDTFAASHPSGDTEIVSWGLAPDGTFDGKLALHRAGALEEILRSPAPPPAPVPPAGDLLASFSRAEHAAALGRLRAAIERGDIYQGNLTCRFETSLPGDGVPLFESLLRGNPAPHAAFLETEGMTVISASPERLLRADGRLVETRPIKGTAARDEDPAEDAARARALAASPKDRAELLMITDLLRNDLGKVCRFGSVRVPRLQEVESFAHVHHLVSTVVGELRPGADVLDALAAVLPGGSITGAPKRRAVEILAGLEPVPRGAYTGSVGWIGFDRSADFNVAIRSGHLRNGRFSFGAGGGIVWDSTADAEWDELCLKALGMRRALGLETAAEAGAR
ncbi:MAG TPA: anthranilate synthase component I family protein [bacterium]|nr:anthranilate synthase component I family protein [bacterium]